MERLKQGGANKEKFSWILSPIPRVYGNYNYRIHGFLYTKQNLAPPPSPSQISCQWRRVTCKIPTFGESPWKWKTACEIHSVMALASYDSYGQGMKQLLQLVG